MRALPSCAAVVDGRLVLRQNAETPCQWKRWESPTDALATHARRA